MCIRKLLPVIVAFIATTVRAQVNTDEIQLIIKTSRPEVQLHYPDQIKKFYTTTGFNYAWLNNRGNIQALFQLLRSAEEHGLKRDDYQSWLIQLQENNYFIGSTRHDSLITDLCLTDAAIHFFNDLAYGSRKPAIGYNGLNYTPNCFDIPLLTAAATAGNRLPGFASDLEPDIAGFKTLKDWLAVLRQSLNDSLYKEEKITSPFTRNGNQPLVNRLYYLGIIDSLNITYTDASIRGKVRSAQRLFNLNDDGILNKATIEAFNKPLTIRIKELEAAMNTVRWLRCLSMQSPVFVVNIPSANLLVIQKGQVLLQSKVIVGKRSTPTPTLASMITDVVLYPYWVVPNKIATRELLPLIQRNAGYLEANNMQVLNKAGKIVNPGSIDWNSLSPSNFPYTLRQSTGCDNSLGIVKLNFYSPYSVYLHDTPWKVLFNFNKRYFSHGCMRVEKAIELAHFLLQENTIAIDTLEEKGCIRNQTPIPIPVKEHTPVIVLYNTAWFDSTGAVQFNDDIYRKNNFE